MLGDRGGRDVPVGPDDHEADRVGVEPGLQPAGGVADHGDVGGLTRVAGRRGVPSWVDGRTLISFTPRRIRVSRVRSNTCRGRCPRRGRRTRGRGRRRGAFCSVRVSTRGCGNICPTGCPSAAGPTASTRAPTWKRGRACTGPRRSSASQPGRFSAAATCPRAGDGLVRRRQDATHRNRHVDHGLRVVATFRVVGVQEGVAGNPAKYAVSFHARLVASRTPEL